MFPSMRFIILVMFMLVGAALPLHAQTSSYEINIDRAGSDYSSFFLSEADPQNCRSACLEDAQCNAWTYVLPGYQGPQAKCWLKDSVPGQSANTATISGVISDRPAPIAADIEPSCSMTGRWTTNHHALELQQSGRTITGLRLDATTGVQRGEVTATMNGDRVSGNHTRNMPNPLGPTGELNWVMDADCEGFTGTWSVDGVAGGTWNGTRSAPAAPSPDREPSSALAFSSLEGIWETSQGVWEPEQKDDTYYFGFYTNDDGRISGDLIGTVFEGYWIEDNSSQKCAYQRNGSDHWGRVRFEFNQELTEFTGTWGYCDNPPTGNSWSGERIAATPASDTFVDAELEVCETHGWDMSIGDSYSCNCQPYRSVAWTEYNYVVGSGPYAPSSTLCLAALHGDAIGQDGGNITVRAVAEETPYLNRLGGGGVIDSSHLAQEFGFSLSIDGANETPGSWRPRVAGIMVDRKEPGDSFPMYCPKEWSRAGTVFGSGPYHGISQICPAAVHAGVITKEGGFITFIVSPPQDSYRGTKRNGITTQDDGPAGRKNSFTFAGAGNVVASAVPEDTAMPGIVENIVSDQWRPIGDLACMTESLHFKSKPLSTPGTCYMCFPDAPSQASKFYMWSDKMPDDGDCLLEGG